MGTSKKITLSVAATVNAPVEKVWLYWTTPKHIVQWNNASNDWHTPKAINDLRKNGTFSYRMEAKDKNLGFDFEGRYTDVITNECIEYIISDGRKVQVLFEALNDETHITETFEAEELHPAEMQLDGWQAILNNFKRYTETH